jgi:hypothetical protein
MFLCAVGAYIYLLVNLNVTLESASGNSNPVLSKVITLMCILPLITGIGNGYYKLKLDYKTDLEHSKRHNEELELLKLDKELEFKKSLQEAEIRKTQEQSALELQKLQADNELKLRKFQIKSESSRNTNGTSGSTSETSKTTSRSDMEVPKTNGSSKTTSGSMGRPSVHQERVFSYLEDAYKMSGGVVPTFTDVMRDLELPESTASRLRNKWLEKKQES